MPPTCHSDFLTSRVHRRSQVTLDPLKTAKKPYARPVRAPVCVPVPLPRHVSWDLPTLSTSWTTTARLPSGSYALRTRTTKLVPFHKFIMVSNLEKKLSERHQWQDETRDCRYDVPLQKERIQLGRRLNHPWQILQDEYPSIKEQTGVDAALARWRLCNSDYATEAWHSIRKATWTSTSALLDHGYFTVAGVPLNNTPMPTHLAYISQASQGQETSSIIVPVHSNILRASWSRLKQLPTDGFVDRGANTPDRGYAEGTLPFVHLMVDNVRTFGPLLTYTYLQDEDQLFQALLGPSAAQLRCFVGRSLSISQRDVEWAISMEFGREHSHSVLQSVLLFIRDLAENGNCVGMEGTHFWWILDACIRIVNDAIIAKHRFEPQESALPTTDGYSADISGSEKEVGDDVDIVESSVYEERIHATLPTTSTTHKNPALSRSKCAQVEKSDAVATKAGQLEVADKVDIIESSVYEEQIHATLPTTSTTCKNPPPSQSKRAKVMNNKVTTAKAKARHKLGPILIMSQNDSGSGNKYSRQDNVRVTLDSTERVIQWIEQHACHGHFTNDFGETPTESGSDGSFAHSTQSGHSD